MQSAEGDNSNLKHSIKREVITELLDPPGMTSSLLSQEIQCERMWKYHVYSLVNLVVAKSEELISRTLLGLFKIRLLFQDRVRSHNFRF